MNNYRNYLFIIIFIFFSNNIFAYTIEKSVIRPGILFNKKEIVKLILTVENQKIKYYAVLPKRSLTSYYQGTFSNKLLPNNFTINLSWYDSSKYKKIKFDLSTDEVLSGILKDMKNNNVPDDECELIITTYFDEDIYSKNKLYRPIFLASEEKKKQEKIIKLKEKQKKEMIQKEKERREQFLYSIYSKIKSGELKKINNNISFEEEQLLWNIMVDDKFGQKLIPENSNDLQRATIEKKNISIKQTTLTNYFKTIKSSVIYGEFTFNEMQKMYTPKKNMYGILLDRAIPSAEQELKKDGIIYRIPKNKRREAIISQAKYLLKDYPLEFGNESDFIITYGIPIYLNSLNTDKIDYIDDHTKNYKPKIILIINVPAEYIINYNYGTKFYIEGKPQITENSYEYGIKQNWEYNEDYIIIYDFRKIKIKALN